MKREEFIQRIKRMLAVHPVAAILGPRQCGKSTLANEYIQNQPDFNSARERLARPKLILTGLAGLLNPNISSIIY